MTLGTDHEQSRETGEVGQRGGAQPRRARRTAGWTAALTVLAICVWILAPVALAVYAAIALTREDVIGQETVWLSPGQGEGTQNRAVGLQLQWADAEEVVAPAWTGVVQSVYVQAGQTVKSGQKLAMIDGLDRIIVASAIPFARTLQVDDEGPDVRALNLSLSSLGYNSAGDSDRFTWRTLSGTRSLAETAQVPASKDVTAFDPSWVVFLPHEEVRLASVDLQVGAPAPAAGTAIRKTPRYLTEAALVPEADLPADQPSSTGGTESGQQQARIEPVAAAAGESLTLGTTPVQLDETLSKVASESLVAIEPLLAVGAPFTRGTLSRSIPADEYRVPPSAIITEPNGQMCVLRAREFGDDGQVVRTEPVAVQFVSAQGASAWVTGDLTVNDKLNAEPTGHERSCLP